MSSEREMFSRKYICPHRAPISGTDPVSKTQLGPKTGIAGAFKGYGEFFEAFRQQVAYAIETYLHDRKQALKLFSKKELKWLEKNARW